MAVEYAADELARIHRAVEEFWADQTGEEMGLIRRGVVFDFFNELIGAAAYNRGVADAQAYLQGKLLDLEIDLHEDVQYGGPPGDSGEASP